jgi:plasmid stabilization system protein ParE
VGRRSRGPEGPPPAAALAPLARPVRLSALATRDLQHARDWFDGQEEGLSDKFLASVEQALARISRNPHQYQVTLLDLHPAPVRPFQDSLWYRVLPDESIVVAALSDRRGLRVGAPKGVAPVEPT